jgi:outer membrane protein assembly factor BamE
LSLPSRSPSPLPLPRGRVLALALLATALAGCESLDRTDSLFGAITPYRIDIVQGNAVTQEQMALIRPGITRLQVRDVLGTPLLTDPFHTDRWDYLFTLRRPGADLQRRSVVIFFDGDRVKSVEAPKDLPTEREFVASISPLRKVAPVKLDLTEEERRALPPPARPAAAPEAGTPAQLGPVRSYPPLEPG